MTIDLGDVSAKLFTSVGRQRLKLHSEDCLRLGFTDTERFAQLRLDRRALGRACKTDPQDLRCALGGQQHYMEVSSNLQQLLAIIHRAINLLSARRGNHVVVVLDNSCGRRPRSCALDRASSFGSPAIPRSVHPAHTGSTQAFDYISARRGLSD